MLVGRSTKQRHETPPAIESIHFKICVHPRPSVVLVFFYLTIR
jgi:hypothetical protein